MHGAPKRTCPRCAKLFRIEEYEAHLSRCGNNSFSCEVCGTKFRGIQYLIQHTTRGRCYPVKNKPPLNEINAAEETTAGLGEEIIRPAHDNEDVNPEREEKNSVTFDGGEETMGNSSTVGKYKIVPCESCDRIFLSHKEVTNHMKSCLRKEKVMVNDKQVPIKQPLLEKSLDKLYWCHTCGISTSSYTKARTHKLTKHLEKPYQCTHCAKKFITVRSLNLHAPLCASRKEKCQICGLRYKNKQSVKLHIKRFHPGGVASGRMDTLGSGCTEVQNEIPYPCNNCGTRFASAEQLAHHTDEKHKDSDSKSPKSALQFKHREGSNVSIVTSPQDKSIELKTEIHIEDTVLQERHV